MTKEELVELSDLNREDNVKYISSEALGIAIALNSDIYAPILCKLERAYICGRRKSEKRIAELEETNERIASKYYELQETLKKVRVALIQERVANIMNYGNGGVEMFDDLLKMTEQEAD